MDLYSTFIVGSHSRRWGMDHIFLPANYTIPRKRSPDGATTNWSGRHLIAAYCWFVDADRMKGWVGLVGWPIADDLPTKWSPISCRSSAGQGKFAGVLALPHSTNLNDHFCCCCWRHDTNSYALIGLSVSWITGTGISVLMLWYNKKQAFHFAK